MLAVKTNRVVQRQTNCRNASKFRPIAGMHQDLQKASASVHLGTVFGKIFDDIRSQRPGDAHSAWSMVHRNMLCKALAAPGPPMAAPVKGFGLFALLRGRAAMQRVPSLRTRMSNNE